MASTALLELLGAAGNAFDLPGSMLRDVISLENPLDQLLSPFSDKDRVTGRELNRRLGLAGQEDNWGNFGGGLLTENLLDPLNWATLGSMGAVKAIAGLGDEALQGAAKVAGPRWNPNLTDEEALAKYLNITGPDAALALPQEVDIAQAMALELPPSRNVHRTITDLGNQVTTVDPRINYEDSLAGLPQAELRRHADTLDSEGFDVEGGLARLAPSPELSEIVDLPKRIITNDPHRKGFSEGFDLDIGQNPGGPAMGINSPKFHVNEPEFRGAPPYMDDTWSTGPVAPRDMDIRHLPIQNLTDATARDAENLFRLAATRLSHEAEPAQQLSQQLEQFLPSAGQAAEQSPIRDIAAQQIATNPASVPRSGLHGDGWPLPVSNLPEAAAPIAPVARAGMTGQQAMAEISRQPVIPLEDLRQRVRVKHGVTGDALVDSFKGDDEIQGLLAELVGVKYVDPERLQANQAFRQWQQQQTPDTLDALARMIDDNLPSSERLISPGGARGGARLYTPTDGGSLAGVRSPPVMEDALQALHPAEMTTRPAPIVNNSTTQAGNAGGQVIGDTTLSSRRLRVKPLEMQAEPSKWRGSVRESLQNRKLAEAAAASADQFMGIRKQLPGDEASKLGVLRQLVKEAEIDSPHLQRLDELLGELTEHGDPVLPDELREFNKGIIGDLTGSHAIKRLPYSVRQYLADQIPPLPPKPRRPGPGDYQGLAERLSQQELERSHPLLREIIEYLKSPESRGPNSRGLARQLERMNVDNLMDAVQGGPTSRLSLALGRNPALQERYNQLLGGERLSGDWTTSMVRHLLNRHEGPLTSPGMRMAAKARRAARPTDAATNSTATTLSYFLSPWDSHRSFSAPKQDEILRYAGASDEAARSFPPEVARDFIAEHGDAKLSQMLQARQSLDRLGANMKQQQIGLSPEGLLHITERHRQLPITDRGTLPNESLVEDLLQQHSVRDDYVDIQELLHPNPVVLKLLQEMGYINQSRGAGGPALNLSEDVAPYIQMLLAGSMPAKSAVQANRQRQY